MVLGGQAKRSHLEKGFAILAFSVVFLQKLGFGLFSSFVGLDNFILIGVLIWLFASGDAVIAVGGRYGTLAEIGLALTLGRPVVVLDPGWQVEGTQRAQTPAEAVELALAAARTV